MRIHRYKHCTCGLQTRENPSADPTEKPANSLNPGICYIKPLNVPGVGNICQYDQREFDRSLCFSPSKLIEKQLMAVCFYRALLDLLHFPCATLWVFTPKHRPLNKREIYNLTPRYVDCIARTFLSPFPSKW